jgi:hypothetical protein
MCKIFNTNIDLPSFLVGCLPVIGPVYSEYLILFPGGGSQNIDSYGCLHQARIEGQIFSSNATQTIPFLHRHVTVGFAAAAIGSLTTIVAGFANNYFNGDNPLLLGAGVWLAYNTYHCYSRASEMYSDAYLFGYAR